jgi:diguanylate cyclase (GGDEF)-like protein
LQPLATSLNYGLVAVSVSISIISSYAAFSFAERVAKSLGRIRALWLVSGAVSMGLGIWSMHCIGMLAVGLPVNVYYYVPTVLVSLLLAILGAFGALLVVSGPKLEIWQLATGSMFMASGIGAMHYSGVHAMRCSAMHNYEPGLVLLSLAVAVIFSWSALWVTFFIGSQRDRQELLRVGGAMIMGIGIAATHYTAMSAVAFWPGTTAFSTKYTLQITTIGAAAVIATIGLVLLGALVCTQIDRAFYEQLRKERDYLHAVAECSLDSLYLCEAIRNSKGEIEDFRFTYLNSNVEKATKLPLPAMLGSRMCEVLPMIQTLGHFELYKQVAVSGEPLITELSFVDKEQNTEWVRIQAVKLRDGLVITASDITSRKRDEEHIRHLAHHDPLTGLVNRSLLHDRINQARERSKRYGGLVGIFLIDVDRFKQINDTFGHLVGDGVLIAVATRLKSAVRAVDSVIRIGGDEFVIVMPEMKEWSDAEQCAEKFVSAFQSAIWIDGRSVSVTCSVGVSLYEDYSFTSVELLAEADAAMYIAKRRGKNQVEIWQGDSESPLKTAVSV